MGCVNLLPYQRLRGAAWLAYSGASGCCGSGHRLVLVTLPLQNDRAALVAVLSAFCGCLQIRSAAAETDAEDDRAPAQPELPPVVKQSLLQATVKARKDKPEESEAEIMLREEQEMLADMTKRTALKGVKELAKVCILG